MELLVASAVGMMTAAGIYLFLRLRTFPVILGLALLSYAVNMFLFATGRLIVGAPAILSLHLKEYTDPLPQALVLTAIVISFGMTALVVILSLGAYLETGNDRIDMEEPLDAAQVDPAQATPEDGPEHHPAGPEDTP
ncbi:cation:proton antiporter [Defluviimonas sp. 20V17]|uniref:Multisubunit potassium/proton antiporter, PhaC subunit n=1 Tax=Allgaiera indica TaxID=765699 RepID=A0AAN4UTL3_9RHOB|nr:Na+/H+ antiporter subunit C [Allgaiera indica]KDB01921.1 cation:proton antiporter [Defluviimonas sp. 20V17]GHE03424.1 Na+/H+ antiporter subunit C [Allgaiera indica]SDX25363.1 multisubunit potassium/proton antiporter, PhaC subunit [Allgaiera indica]